LRAVDVNEVADLIVLAPAGRNVELAKGQGLRLPQLSGSFVFVCGDVAIRLQRERSGAGSVPLLLQLPIHQLLWVQYHIDNAFQCLPLPLGLKVQFDRLGNLLWESSGRVNDFHDFNNLQVNLQNLFCRLCN
jgi:hypothetical protein